jgi:hypothetical protein
MLWMHIAVGDHVIYCQALRSDCFYTIKIRYDFQRNEWLGSGNFFSVKVEEHS